MSSELQAVLLVIQQDNCAGGMLILTHGWSIS